MQNASIIEYSMSYTGDSTFFFLMYEDETGRSRLYTEAKALIAFSFASSAAAKAEAYGMHLRQTAFFDAERLDYWIFTGSRSQIYTDDILDTEFLLDFWHLFEAAAYSLGIKLPVPEGAEVCFQKLLRSTDPAVLAADPDAVNPVISENELEIIRHDLQSGIELIAKYTSLSDRR